MAESAVGISAITSVKNCDVDFLFWQVLNSHPSERQALIHQLRQRTSGTFEAPLPNGVMVQLPCMPFED